MRYQYAKNIKGVYNSFLELNKGYNFKFMFFRNLNKVKNIYTNILIIFFEQFFYG